MITFKVEKWRELYPELSLLLPKHWEEIAISHKEVPLDVDYDKYAELCDTGILHILTARDDTKLIGYHVAMICGHIHYKSTLHGITDVYYVLPEYRGRMVGVRLFKEVELSMRERGVVKLYTGTKIHHDMGRLFERLGYHETERLYTKLLVD